MRDVYVKELEEYSSHLAEMTAAVNDQVYRAIKAFNENDVEASQDIQEKDLQINQMATSIEKEAYRLVALQQPVAEDLRLIFSVLSMSVDLERIADHAHIIAQNVKRVEDGTEKVQSLVEIINEMAKVAMEMLGQVNEVFHSRDQEIAIQLAQRDELIDAGLKALYQQSTIRMANDREVVSSGINYIDIGNSIERIGYYITNICERIIYLNEAEIVDLNQ